jgi:two-component system sensor histidine kinase CpxA
MISRQGQLIQDISHELRSPLARLHVALGLTRKYVNEEAEQDLDRIEREANRLESLISQVLTLARLEESKIDVLEEYIDIAELLKSIVNDAEYEAADRNCHVHLECKTQATLKANGELLYRAIENIIRNAVKYTTESTTVNVVLGESKKHKGWINISVRDYGQGVPEEQLPNLFEPFFRVSKSRDRDSGGYGLGLAIAKHAIGLHGGELSARNCKNRGLCVDVSLPLNME